MVPVPSSDQADISDYFFIELKQTGEGGGGGSAQEFFKIIMQGVNKSHPNVYLDNSQITKHAKYSIPSWIAKICLSNRSNIYRAKVMLCIWWDQFGVVYYEFLKPSITITRGSVSNAIDAFEPKIEGETATVPRKTQQRYPPV